MKQNHFITAALATALLLCPPAAYGQGRITASKQTTTFQLEEPEKFNQIHFSGSGEIEYRQSTDGKTRVTVTVAENLLDYLIVEVDDGELRNRYKNESKIKGDTRLKIVAESPTLEVMSIAGSGAGSILGTLNSRRIALHVAGSGTIKATSLQCKETIQAKIAGSGEITVSEGETGKTSLSVTGSGEIQINSLQTKQITTSITGSGEITLTGTAQTAKYKVTGRGEIHADGMKADQVHAQITGSGTINCHTTESLSSKVTGSGEIIYEGNPKVINSNTRPKNTRKDTSSEELEGV